MVHRSRSLRRTLMVILLLLVVGYVVMTLLKSIVMSFIYHQYYDAYTQAALGLSRTYHSLLDGNIRLSKRMLHTLNQQAYQHHKGTKADIIMHYDKHYHPLASSTLKMSRSRSWTSFTRI